MNKREFIQTCVKCGYANKRVAVAYARNKSTFTEKDLEEAFRINEKDNYCGFEDKLLWSECINELAPEYLDTPQNDDMLEPAF